jgi:hypothetical protein
MARNNRQSAITRFTTVQAGIDKHAASGVMLGGVDYSAASLKGVFAGAVTALTQADNLHKQWQDAVQAARTAETNANGVYELLRSHAVGQFGKTANTALNDFGMAVPKARGPMTVEAKAAAAQKRKATREVRHTMGSTQKKSVKGTVEVPAPGVAPATVTTTPPAAAGGASPPAARTTATKVGS